MRTDLILEAVGMQIDMTIRGEPQGVPALLLTAGWEPAWTPIAETPIDQSWVHAELDGYVRIHTGAAAGQGFYLGLIANLDSLVEAQGLFGRIRDSVNRQVQDLGIVESMMGGEESYWSSQDLTFSLSRLPGNNSPRRTVAAVQFAVEPKAKDSNVPRP